MKLKVLIHIIVIGIMLAVSYQFLSALDAPHNESNNVNCGNCHGQTLLNSPFWTNSEDYDIICTSCHKAESGPYSQTNAPIAWLPLVTPHANRQCRDCHNPHYQRQKIYKNTDTNNLYLAQGKITSCVFTCPVCPEVIGTTTLTYSSIIYKTNPDPLLSWDAARLIDKTEKGGSDKRSAILFPNLSKLGYSYPIIAVDTPTITVYGNAAAFLCPSQDYECDPLCCDPCCDESCTEYPNCDDPCPPPKTYSCTPSLPTDFAAMYGQYVKDSIDVSTDSSGTYSKVKFLDKKGQGSFAYDESGTGTDPTHNGVCQVCHTDQANPTNPTHWRADGTGADHYNDNVYENGCIYCHSHKSGFFHCSSENAGCHTGQSHTTHLTLNSKGPASPLGCIDCHDTDNCFKDDDNYCYFESGTDSNGDGKYDLSETNVCDGCHSPDGSFDGVGDYDPDNPNFETENPLSVAYGAKYNWKTGIYSNDSLTTGKEKWCISCHDSGTSEISSVSSPNVELYYTSGHGKAGADVECLVCHDAAFTHIDGKPRTYTFSNEDVNPADGHADMYDMAKSGVAYAAGYRLRYVNGEVPIMVPTDYTYTFGNQEGMINSNAYRRCFNTGCHDFSKIFGRDSFESAYTNFRSGPPDPPRSYGGGNYNLHEYHRTYSSWDSDWDNDTKKYPNSLFGRDSMFTCSSCHNVHGASGIYGSTNEPMIRDGILEGRVGYGFSYLIEDLVLHYPYVTSQGATRANSVGAVFRNGTSGMSCASGCHGTEDTPPEGSYYTAPTIILYNGVHTGSTSNTTLKVDGNPWTEGELVGKYINNITDKSGDNIIGNTSNTVTGIYLTGGNDNLWEPGDQAEIFEHNNSYMEYFRSPHDLSLTVDMIWTYDSHGGKNYSDLSAWEQDTDIDITAANDLIVLSHNGLTGSISSGNTVTGANSGATGEVIGVVTATQICIDVSSGAFQNGEQIYQTPNVNYVVSTMQPHHVGVMYLDCYDGPHVDRVTMAGAITDGMHYRCIRSASDCTTPFAGTRETGAYFEWNANNHLFRLEENFARVENIGAKLTYTSDSGTNKNVFWLLGDHTKAIGCVAYDSTNTGLKSVNGGFSLEGCETVAANCIAHNIEGDGFILYGQGYPCNHYAINCTAVNNGGTGFKQYLISGFISFWNCVASNNAGDDFFIIPSGYYFCESNMSSDNTAPGVTSKINKDFTGMWVDETAGSEDYHLSETGVVDSDFQDGTDLEILPFYFPPYYGQYEVADDIDGEPRTIWYRGADEFGPPGNDYEFIYISGRVGTLDGVTMNGLPGSPVTNGDGFYSAVAGYGWSGTVTPEKQGYTFDPANRSYSNVTSDQTNQDYTPAINTYTISGHVGTLDGVTMNGLPGSPVTSGGGFYSATVYYGTESIYVTPTKEGYGFTPASRSYYDVASDQTNQDYTPAIKHIISGSIGTLDGVTMNGLPGNPVTSGGGFYSGNVDDGWSGTASPSKVGYIFAPTNRSYSNVTTDQTNQDYTPTEASYTISGRVGTLDGVTMDGLPGNPVTSGGGFYSAIVGYGWTSWNNVEPTKVGYNFNPSSRYYSNVTSNWTNQDYTPSVKTFTISGYASNNLSGVTMNGLPGNPVTNSSGFYTATVNWGWSGTVTPTKAGYTFNPTNRVYSYVTYNQSDQNYTHTP